ncbi:MAG TPA: TRAP transporter substrate-binding protein [Xanthobacteraceae bacterium]|jgi:TRAP-type C4-dicarboxylate transport system substrate-binding protein
MLRKATLLLAAGALFAFGAAPALAQKQTLRMAYWAGPAHHMVKTQEAWIKAIEEASGGNLTVELDKAPLAKPDGQYDLVKNGVRDMVWAIPTYTPGRFDMLAAGEIPFLCPNATVCSPALSRWYRKHKLDEKEFTDTKLLNVFVHGPGMLHTVKPVKTLEEIKGIKVRAGGAGVAISQALGMSAVAMPATQAHEALSRGTVEGVLFPWEAVESFRLTEAVKAHLEIPGGMYTATFVIIINNDAFKKLSPSNQAALMKVSGDAGSRLFGKHWDEADARARENAKKAGNAIQTLAPAELERWKPMLQFVRDEWLKKAKDRGLDGPALLKDLEATIKATSS